MSGSSRRGLLSRIIGLEPTPRAEQPLAVRPEVNPSAGLGESASLPEVRLDAGSIPDVNIPPTLIDQLMQSQMDRRTFMERARTGAMAARALPDLLRQGAAPVPTPAPATPTYDIGRYLFDYDPSENYGLLTHTNVENRISQALSGARNYQNMRFNLRNAAPGNTDIETRILENIAAQQRRLRGQVESHNAKVKEMRGRDPSLGEYFSPYDVNQEVDEFNRMTALNPEFIRFRRALAEDPQLDQFVEAIRNPTFRDRTPNSYDEYGVRRLLMNVRDNLYPDNPRMDIRTLTEEDIGKYYNNMLDRMSERTGVSRDRLEQGLHRRDTDVLRYMYGSPDENISGRGENPFHMFLSRRINPEDLENFDSMFRDYNIEPRTLFEVDEPWDNPMDYDREGHYRPMRFNTPPGGSMDGPED